MVVRVTAIVQLTVSGLRPTSGGSRPTSGDPPGRTTGSSDPRGPSLGFFVARRSPKASEASAEKRGGDTSLSRFGSGSFTVFF
jgi:hypothetical protein